MNNRLHGAIRTTGRRGRREVRNRFHPAAEGLEQRALLTASINGGITAQISGEISTVNLDREDPREVSDSVTVRQSNGMTVAETNISVSAAFLSVSASSHLSIMGVPN